MKEMKVESIKIKDLVPYGANARIHDENQIEKIMESIKEFGFIAPVIIDENKVVLVGHGRIEAAKNLGIEEVPCVYVDEDLDDEHKRAYILADNLLTERGGWDSEILQNEIDEIDMDLTSFGFESVEESISDMEIEEAVVLVECPKCGHKFDPDGGDFHA